MNAAIAMPDLVVYPMPQTFAHSPLVAGLTIGVLLLLLFAMLCSRRYIRSGLRALVKGIRRTIDYHTEDAHNNVWGRILYSILAVLGYALYARVNMAPCGTDSDMVLQLLTYAGVIVGVVLLKLLLLRLSGYALFIQGAMRQFIYFNFFTLLLLGVSLALVALLQIYMSAAFFMPLCCIGCFLVVISLLLMSYKYLQFFYRGFASLYYLFLYLCILEILPIAVLVKLGLTQG